MRGWQRAIELARRTPTQRNRTVDLLRAASIGVVVVGHWLMAAPALSRGELTLSDMLHIAPWSQWLTWIFQVMPAFFIVGGYANAASWESALRARTTYGAWLGVRLRRLVAPLIPLVIVWTGMAVAAPQLGVEPDTIRIGSQAAFIPTWFLAVYVMVVAAVPASFAAWRRYGMRSFWGLTLCAAAVDALAFAAGHAWLRGANYAFVWLGVHQLGYAWRAGALGTGRRALARILAAVAAMLALVFLGSYPVSMITVPGEAVSNSSPPTLALLALGVTQAGIVRLVEKPLERWLRRERAWALTVLVNGRIMTLYLWHATAMVWLVGVAYALGGIGLRLEPNSGAWWASRPLWIAVCAAALAACVAAFGRFERSAGAANGPLPSAWRGMAGAAVVCVGLGLLATGGIAKPEPLGVRLVPLALTLAGVGLATGRSLPACAFGGRRSGA
jgi:hypothetical protein